MALTIPQKLGHLSGRTLGQMHNLIYRLEGLELTGDDLNDTAIKRCDVALSFPSAVSSALDKINILLGTKYKNTHYYNWMAETVPVPGTVRKIMIRDIFHWLYEDKAAAENFRGFWT